MHSRVYSCNYISPAGIIRITAGDNGITNLAFPDSQLQDPLSVSSFETHPVLQQLITELDAYFAGNLKTFTVPLSIKGTTFQQKVWEAVSAIPFGKVATYAEISIRLQQPEAIRAVANANARNPLLILIPCHRVIGSDGHLTGYAAGLPRKKLLLELEGSLKPTRQLSLL